MKLDHSLIPERDAVRVDHERLRRLVSAIFQSQGLSPEDAGIVAQVLVAADLRGLDSHGVSYFIRMIYLPHLARGIFKPRPTIRVIRETPATAMLDGDRGLGHVTGRRAMALAIEKAQATGVGVVAVTNATHYGIASYYAMMALEHDMIGMTSCNGRPQMVPTFGSRPAVGTNPLCIAAPTAAEPPFVLDMATTTVSEGKIVVARQTGQPIPPGWVVDEHGNTTTDPEEALEGTWSQRLFLSPLGGTRELGSHKGYGLGVAMDILSGVLSGVGFALMLPERVVGHFFLALHVDAFRPVDEFKRMMDDMIRGLRSTPPAKGAERVYVPGEPEAETQQERLARGIPLHREVVAYLRGLVAELEMEPTLADIER